MGGPAGRPLRGARGRAPHHAPHSRHQERGESPRQGQARAVRYSARVFAGHGERLPRPRRLLRLRLARDALRHEPGHAEPAREPQRAGRQRGRAGDGHDRRGAEPGVDGALPPEHGRAVAPELGHVGRPPPTRHHHVLRRPDHQVPLRLDEHHHVPHDGPPHWLRHLPHRRPRLPVPLPNLQFGPGVPLGAGHQKVPQPRGRRGNSPVPAAPSRVCEIHGHGRRAGGRKHSELGPGRAATPRAKPRSPVALFLRIVGEKHLAAVRPGSSCMSPVRCLFVYLVVC
mmetsp:Transcript_55478/g.126065  ORF Transcript_55478/g.126065 Transcript_55478/m.126065 type:complete len:284 (-) Transcript_55478:1338-2189(-)